jgi:hypothetical protein
LMPNGAGSACADRYKRGRSDTLVVLNLRRIDEARARVPFV